MSVPRTALSIPWSERV